MSKIIFFFLINASYITLSPSVYLKKVIFTTNKIFYLKIILTFGTLILKLYYKIMPYNNLNVLYYSPGKDIIMNKWQEYHFIDELKRSNIKFDIFNPLSFQNLNEAQEKLLKLLSENPKKYTLFFTEVNDTLISPQLISEIKNIGIPTLLICFDNLHAPFLHKKNAKYFDLVWLTSFETESLFKQWGANTYFQPYAANPYIFKASHCEELHTIGFVGTPYGSRILKLNSLLNKNIPVSIYSDSFYKSFNLSLKNKRSISEKAADILRYSKFSIGRKILLSEFIYIINSKKYDPQNLIFNSSLNKNPSVTFEEMIRLYSSFAISLGINEVRNTGILKHPIVKLHLRTFEIPMCGGLQIVNYNDEIASYFEDDKEIVLYKTEEEFVSKAEFYLREENFNKRKKIKENARKRAESDHTWTIRFNKVLEKLGIKMTKY